MFRLIHRALLAAVFLWTSVNVIRNAEHMTGPADALGLPEPVKAVRLHGWINLIGGTMLVLNIGPKLAASVMSGNLVATTAGAHQFWELDDEGEKLDQMIHFFKNLSLLGGLLGIVVSRRSQDDA